MNLGLLSEFLGLRVSPLKVAGLATSPAQSHDEFSRVTAEQRRQFPSLIQDVMNTGGVVMVDGGWSSQAKGLVPWVFWGIITKADSGTILGASFNGRNDNPIEYLDGCWAVRPAKASLAQDKADLRMLQLACDRIRGEGAFSRGDVVFGLRAMDLWIRQMETVRGVCPGCFESAPDRAWTDAHDPASTAFHGALTVSSYLDKRRDAFPQPARPHVAATAQHYAAMADLLKPALTGNGGSHYRDFVGDIDRQKEHANRALRPVRDGMAKAADEIDKALAASAMAGAGQARKGGRR